MTIRFTNNASALLASSITNSATTIALQTGQGALFPALTGTDYFYATLINSSGAIEIVKVTARTGDSLTVSRGVDNTVASPYSAGDRLELRPTAASLSDLASFAGSAYTPAADPGSNGIISRTGAGLSSAVTITAGGGISVANGNGISGNPTISNTGVLSIAAGSGIAISAATGSVTISSTVSVPVSSVFGRTGAVTLSSSDVTGALGFTPASNNGSNVSGTWGINITGSAGYASSAGSATSASYAAYLSGAPAFTNGSDGWWRSNGQAGLYFNSYGRGVYPTDGVVSYGSACVFGSGLNGWQGWSVNTNNTCILMSNGGTHGLYNAAGGVWMYQTDSSGNATFNGNVTAYSDLRLKQNVREIDNVTARRDTLAAAAIKYERDGQTRIGYGAQYLRDGGCNEFVREAQDDAYKLATGVGTLSVDYGETAAVLAVASKMTDDKVAALEAKIEQLEKIIQELTK